MRLTNGIRDAILYKAMTGVPAIDYIAKLVPVIQGVIYKHMPDKVKAVYDDEDSRKYLHSTRCVIKDGNKWYWVEPLLRGLDNANNLEIQINPDAVSIMKKGTLRFDLSKAVIATGYVEKHIEQVELRKDVERRLRNTLRSVTTTKRLREVLEPELHHLIPVESASGANLPALAAPVVSDLRKLGAQLPDVPKAK